MTDKIVKDMAIALGEALAWAENLPPGAMVVEFRTWPEGDDICWEGKAVMLGGSDHPVLQRDSSLAREHRTRNRATIVSSCIEDLGAAPKEQAHDQKHRPVRRRRR